MRSQRGSVLVIVLVVLAGILAAPKVVPHLFDGRTKEADKSVATTSGLLEASASKAAAQTASAVVIGEAAADLPASPNRSFILNEVPIMLARGPAPDSKQLLAARDRRIAYLEGKLDAQREQTEAALKDAAKITAKLTAAEIAKHDSDSALIESAAVSRGKDLALTGVALVAVLLLAAFVWVKLQAGGLTSALSKIVPTLDAHGTDSIYSDLSKRFDATEKRLIHQLRAKLTK
jgi:hypothetical protein